MTWSRSSGSQTRPRLSWTSSSRTWSGDQRGGGASLLDPRWGCSWNNIVLSSAPDWSLCLPDWPNRWWSIAKVCGLYTKYQLPKNLSIIGNSSLMITPRNSRFSIVELASWTPSSNTSLWHMFRSILLSMVWLCEQVQRNIWSPHTVSWEWWKKDPVYEQQGGREGQLLIRRDYWGHLISSTSPVLVSFLTSMKRIIMLMMSLCLQLHLHIMKTILIVRR